GVHPPDAPGRRSLTAAGKLGRVPLSAGTLAGTVPAKARVIASESCPATAWAWACDMPLFIELPLPLPLPHPPQRIDSVTATTVKHEDALLFIGNIGTPYWRKVKVASYLLGP